MNPDDARAIVRSPRYLAKVEKVEGGCWMWTGALNNNGYPKFRFERKAQYAHRIALVARLGHDDFQHTDHLCRNPACVNPDHLEGVTASVNVRRGLKSALKETCGAGLHPWVEENIYVRPDTGRAHCKPCGLMKQAAYRERKRNESQSKQG